MAGEHVRVVHQASYESSGTAATERSRRGRVWADAIRGGGGGGGGGGVNSSARLGSPLHPHRELDAALYDVDVGGPETDGRNPDRCSSGS